MTFDLFKGQIYELGHIFSSIGCRLVIFGMCDPGKIVADLNLSYRDNLIGELMENILSKC